MAAPMLHGDLNQREVHAGFRHERRARRGFTLLEVLVAAAVLSVLLVLLLGVISSASRVTREATQSISAFQNARAAFDLMVANLGQATLGTYWDYDDINNPQRYLRRSQLHFLIGEAGQGDLPGTAGTGQAVAFQLPAGRTEDNARFRGLTNLLNAVGYFVDYGPETNLPSPFPQGSRNFRYRLMQALEPTELLGVYGSSTAGAWLTGLNNPANQIPIADNIIHLTIWPRLSPVVDPEGEALTSNFAYNSLTGADTDPQPANAHQLPPVLQVTMVALAEDSAARVCINSTQPSEIQSALNGLFTSSSQSRFEADIDELESRLAADGLAFQVFTALVPIRESRVP